MRYRSVLRRKSQHPALGESTATAGLAAGVQRGPAEATRPVKLSVRRLGTRNRDLDVTYFYESHRRVIGNLEKPEIKPIFENPFKRGEVASPVLSNQRKSNQRTKAVESSQK